MRNILHIIPTLSERGGGGDLATLELALSQSKKTEIGIVRFRTDSDFKLPEQITEFAFEKNLLGRIRYAFKISNIIMSYDVIHVHSSWRLTNSLAAYSALKKNKKVIFQPHGVFDLFRMRRKAFLKRVYFRLIELPIIKKSTVVYESEIEKIVVSKFSETLLYLPCGSNMTPLSEVHGFCRDLVYLGRFDNHKGLIELIQALAMMSERGELEFKVHLAGYDSDGTLSTIKEMINRFGLEGKVFLHPPLSGTEAKQNFLKKGGGFILPSHSDNFGIAVLEGCLRGLYPLVSVNTAWPDILGENNGIFFQSSVEDIYVALLKWKGLKEWEAIQTANENSSYLSAEFSWDKISDKSLDYINMINEADGNSID